MRAIPKKYIVAFTVTLSAVAYGTGVLAQAATVGASTPAANSSATLLVTVGDRLKISFYETIDMGAPKQSGRDAAELQGALRTFYQRMDLTGEYTVEQDGAISIPLLGRFQVGGRAADHLRADLAVSFTTVIGRSANIDVKILDRSPV